MPVKPTGSSNRVLRGGCWGIVASNCRSAYRYGFEPGLRLVGLGFRPARRVVPRALIV
jgi:formylglycine-generating enzyme required for sulfatase activity